MKFREFVLLILIIAAGVLFYHIQTGKLALEFDWEDGVFLSFEEFEFEETSELEPPFPGELQLINTHGDIQIQGADVDRITFRMTKRIRRRSREQAQEVASGLHAVVSRGDRFLTLTNNRNDFRRKNFRTDWLVTVPAETAVRIRNGYGTATLENLAGVFLENTHGTVNARDISGNLTLTNSHRDVTVEHIGGDCQIDSRHSRVTVSGVGGRLHVLHGYGRIDLSHIEREATIEGTHSRIFCRNTPGGLEIETSYEAVDLLDSGPAVIRGHHTSVDADRIRGRLEIKDRYGTVEIRNLEGDLNISGKSLKINASVLASELIEIDTSHESVSLENFSGRTTISLEHGNLYLAPAPPLSHGLEVKGLSCGIRLLWPGDELYPFEAQNKGGDIQWKLEQQPSLRLDNGVSVLKAFTDVTGRPAIKLATSYALIDVFR
jgi:hypothetical protein